MPKTISIGESRQLFAGSIPPHLPNFPFAMKFMDAANLSEDDRIELIAKTGNPRVWVYTFKKL